MNTSRPLTKLMCALSAVCLLPQTNAQQQPQESPPRFDVVTFRAARARLPQPEFILTERLDDNARSQLVEDLQVMDNLLTRAIVGSAGPEGLYRQALGVTVAVEPSQDSRIRYIQDYGVIFTYHVGIPVAEQSTQNTAKTTTPAKAETEWERTRRLLFQPPAVQPASGAVYGGYGAEGPDGSGFGSGGYASGEYADIDIHVQAAPYNSDVVSSIHEGVKDALKNVVQIRALDGKPDVDVETNPGNLFHDDSIVPISPGGMPPRFNPRIVVILLSQVDSSTMTFSTTQDAWKKDDTDKAVAVQQFFNARPKSTAISRTINWSPAASGYGPYNLPATPQGLNEPRSLSGPQPYQPTIPNGSNVQPVPDARAYPIEDSSSNFAPAPSLDPAQTRPRVFPEESSLDAPRELQPSQSDDALTPPATESGVPSAAAENINALPTY